MMDNNEDKRMRKINQKCGSILCNYLYYGKIKLGPNKIRALFEKGNNDLLSIQRLIEIEPMILDLVSPPAVISPDAVIFLQAPRRALGQ